MADNVGARFERLVGIMRALRAPDGCPWDREQTLASLRPFVLEETYEVLDAIESGDPARLREELGDFLYEAVFLAQISEEAGTFAIGDAIDAIAEKLQRREAPEVVTDQQGSPTYARDLARGIEKLLRIGATGTVHVTNSGVTSWHGFAVEIARYLGSPLTVRETTSDRFPRPAPRPKNSVLSGERYRALTGESLPSWQEALHDYLGRRSVRKGAAA